MNKYILILALIIAPSVSANEKCPMIAKIANTVMKAMQGGETMMQLTQANDGLLKTKESWPYYDVTKLIIIDAFESNRRYNSIKIQIRNISDFESKWYLKCYKGAL